MRYNIFDKLYREKEDVLSVLYESYSDEVDKELETVYSKAEAWDRMCEILIDKDMSSEEFEDEMYKLIKQTGKSDILIINDPSIH